MADNTTINTGSGGDVIATDDIGGVKVQRVKVQHGADGSATDVSSASPIEVTTYGERDGTGTLIHRAYGPLRVSEEETTLFLDTHDQALDTTNRWNAATGTNAPSVSSSVLTFGTATTVSIFGKLTSQPTFGPLIPGFLQNSWAISLNTAASTERTGGHRFWGVGNSPTTPATTSAATKLTDAIGFEVDTDGKMYAVVYANGVRTATDLSASGTGFATSAQPLDGLYHRYICQIRTDRIYWFIDTLSQYVATASFAMPTTQTMPLLLQTINPGSAVATGGYPLLVQGSVVADTAGNSTQISDGTYQWRKATVRASAAGNTGLAIAGLAQVSTTGTITTSTSTVTTGDLDLANTLGVSIYGTHAGVNVTFEASFDNTNWSPIGGMRLDTGEVQSTTGVLSTNAIQQWSFTFAGSSYFRVRATAYTSGTANVAIAGSTLPLTPVVAATVSPSTTGGWLAHRLLTAASTNATLVKSSPGQVGGWYFSNTASSARFLKLYNSATIPTAGSGTPVMTIQIPGYGTSGAGTNVEWTQGIAFNAGIGYTVTGAVADADTTALALNEVVVNLMYR